MKRIHTWLASFQMGALLCRINLRLFLFINNDSFRSASDTCTCNHYISLHQSKKKTCWTFRLCNWISLGNDSTKMKITRLKEFMNDFNFRLVFITQIQSTHSLRNCNRSLERKDNFSLSFALLKSKKIKGIDSQKFSVNLKHNLSQVFYRSFKDKF